MNSDINSWIKFVFFSVPGIMVTQIFKKNPSLFVKFLIFFTDKPMFLCLTVTLCNWVAVTACFSTSNGWKLSSAIYQISGESLAKRKHNNQSIRPSVMQDMARSAWFSLIYCQGSKRELKVHHHVVKVEGCFITERLCNASPSWTRVRVV